MKAVQAFLTLVVLAFASQATAGKFWSEDKTTNGLIISANVLTVLDWAQTRYIADNPDQFREVGPAQKFIGEHPSTGEVNSYFMASILLMNGVGYFLPESAVTFGRKWNPKKSLYVGVTAIEGVTVANNFIVLGFRSEH
jgi:hypothetical protein